MRYCGDGSRPNNHVSRNVIMFTTGPLQGEVVKDHKLLYLVEAYGPDMYVPFIVISLLTSIL